MQENAKWKKKKDISIHVYLALAGQAKSSDGRPADFQRTPDGCPTDFHGRPTLTEVRATTIRAVSLGVKTAGKSGGELGGDLGGEF